MGGFINDLFQKRLQSWGSSESDGSSDGYQYGTYRRICSGPFFSRYCRYDTRTDRKIRRSRSLSRRRNAHQHHSHSGCSETIRRSYFGRFGTYIRSRDGVRRGDRSPRICSAYRRRQTSPKRCGKSIASSRR